jgi:hypothetical protein
MLLALFFLLAPLRVTLETTGEIHPQGIVVIGGKKSFGPAELQNRYVAGTHALKVKPNHGSANNRTILNEPQEGR